MPVVNSRATWPLITQEERMKKGPLVKVEISPGRFVKMHQADAIARGLILPEKKRRPTGRDKMRAPGRDKGAPPQSPPGGGRDDEPESERVDDFTVIPGVGPATARVLVTRGITTFEQLRQAGELTYLSERVNAAIEEWRSG